ncbi:hypothetical protein [Clostridium polynesiense]|uniref:hypothetical protein n=1 Tax=Clostridium polynesiense TaxID=1325933 RepID=UPI00058D7B7B|nr:hypothetical protein [Clostridium polynesiense]
MKIKNIIKINGKELNIDNKTIKFKYDIRDTKVVNNQVIVLLSIPFNDHEIDNIYSVSLDGKIKWRVESLNLINLNGENLPYENMFLNN